jgi:hypothetical protein
MTITCGNELGTRHFGLPALLTSKGPSKVTIMQCRA